MVISFLRMLSVEYILFVEKILSVFAALAFLTFALLLVIFISRIFCFTAIYTICNNFRDIEKVCKHKWMKTCNICLSKSSLTQYDCVQIYTFLKKKQTLARHWILPSLDFTASSPQTLRNKYLLFLSC